MAFGFDEFVPNIASAIDDAQRANVLLCAAAVVVNGNDEGSWTARHLGVLGVYATDGYGNKYHANPVPRAGADDFATLGVGCQGYYLRYQSGTSIATSVAAGIASLVLNLMLEMRDLYLQSTNTKNECTTACYTESRRTQ